MGRFATAVTCLALLGASAFSCSAEAGSRDGGFKKVFRAGDHTYRVQASALANTPSLERVTIQVVKFGNEVARAVIEASDPIADARMANLDAVGGPELVITTASTGGGQSGGLAVYELRGSELARAELPRLRADMLKGYLGHDRFTIEEGLVVRRFPRFLPGDPDCCPTGGDVELRYVYRDGKIAEVVPASAPASK